MQGVQMLLQLLQEDRAQSIDKLNCLWTLLEDRQTFGDISHVQLYEDAVIFELKRYEEIEDKIAWIEGYFFTDVIPQK
jgi:hypothetical protein